MKHLTLILVCLALFVVTLYCFVLVIGPALRGPM